MPPLATLLQQRDQARTELAQLEDATIHVAASLIQGCILMNRARRRRRTERSLKIIRSASPQTLSRWHDVESAPLFNNPTLTSILYADYRGLLDRRDIRQLFFSLQSLEDCIKALANRIATYQYQNASKIQRRTRGMRGRARFHQFAEERKRNRHLRNASATEIQKRVRGYQQRQRYRAKVLKIFEQQQLLRYQSERQIDRERRERTEMRAKMMTLYVHERQKDDSRRLFGDGYNAQSKVNVNADRISTNDTRTGPSSEGDTDDLAVTLTSCSKAYLAGDPGLIPARQRSNSRYGTLFDKDERRHLVGLYNRERWGRHTRKVATGR